MIKYRNYALLQLEALCCRKAFEGSVDTKYSRKFCTLRNIEVAGGNTAALLVRPADTAEKYRNVIAGTALDVYPSVLKRYLADLDSR